MFVYHRHEHAIEQYRHLRIVILPRAVVDRLQEVHDAVVLRTDGDYFRRPLEDLRREIFKCWRKPRDVGDGDSRSPFRELSSCSRFLPPLPSIVLRCGPEELGRIRLIRIEETHRKASAERVL